MFRTLGVQLSQEPRQHQNGEKEHSRGNHPGRVEVIIMGVVHKVKRAAAAAESQMNSNTPPPVPASSATPISKYPRFGKRGAPQAFPSKLYEILEGENPEIVGWTATGRGFEVSPDLRHIVGARLMLIQVLLSVCFVFFLSQCSSGSSCNRQWIAC